MKKSYLFKITVEDQDIKDNEENNSLFLENDVPAIIEDAFIRKINEYLKHLYYIEIIDIKQINIDPTILSNN
jgi:hypothetical protein